MENLGDENRNALNDIVSVLGDVLVEIKEMRGAFARTFTLVLDKLDGIRSDLKDVKEEIKGNCLGMALGSENRRAP